MRSQGMFLLAVVIANLSLFTLFTQPDIVQKEVY